MFLEHALATGCVQRIELVVEHLSTIDGRGAGVADKAHGMSHPENPSTPSHIAIRNTWGCRGRLPPNRGPWGQPRVDSRQTRDCREQLLWTDAGGWVAGRAGGVHADLYWLHAHWGRLRTRGILTTPLDGPLNQETEPLVDLA